MAVQHRGLFGDSVDIPPLLELGLEGKEHIPKGILANEKSQSDGISIHEL